MARSRNIKPSIMSNDELAELEPLTRLLFIYLWMLADREGRLEDKPNRIAAQAIPYDRDADANAMLDELVAGGFISRYAEAGVRCIQVIAFEKHQNPHVREAASELPKQGQSTTKAVPKHNLGDDDEASKPEPARLIPDSLLLIPDSIEDTHTPHARGWNLPKAWGDAAIAEFPHWTPDVVRSIAAQFADHQRAKAATSADWEATWRKWCRDELTQKAHPIPKPAVAKPAAQSITVPCTDTRAEKHAADMEARKSDATLPPWAKKVAA